MEMILGVLAANWMSVVIVIGFLALCFYMVKRGYKKNVALWAYILVTKAEEKHGTGTGTLKYAEVLEGIYEKFPSVIRYFFTPEEIDDVIEDCVDGLQDFLLKQIK